MNSSNFFRTENGSCYLYDTNQLELLNVHPVIETIHQFANNANDKDITTYIWERHPELSTSDIRLYQKKYDFLKTYGFFATFDFDKIFTCHTTAKQIENQMINLDAITFQVTGACNLKCHYCCYGELYDNTYHKIQNMDFNTILTFFEYIIPYWNLNSNRKLIVIGFYGGEPLLNFPLIETTVDYCKSLESNLLKFNFCITTNAVLLDRYASYLVENDFKILFSLDGDEKGNRLRVYKNNHPSFKRVFNSIKKFQQEYPDFFKEKVDFNSVLNRYTPVGEVNRFVFNEFGKIPVVSRISDVGLNKEKIKEYIHIMQPYIETEELLLLRQEKSSRIKELGIFFYYNLNNSYKHFSEVFHFNKRRQKKIPTGTCLPFYKKMFITADGKVYACERIGFDYDLGTIDEKVNIDFEKIAQKYATYFSEIKKQCVECYLADMCSECIFQFPSENKRPKCSYQYGEEEYKKHLGRIIGLLEKHPELFDQVNKSVFAG